jgi:catechol 2,3-dioxygenase-like lactoylglutathione lyase family enzyme
MMYHALSHIGWITNDIMLFESFWCDLLGFTCNYKSNLDNPQTLALFGVSGTPEIRRYSHPEWSLEIEIHCLENNATIPKRSFFAPGINHICLSTGKRANNSRERFIQALPAHVQICRYHNPGGWENLFIQDFENNWIELREDFE